MEHQYHRQGQLDAEPALRARRHGVAHALRQQQPERSRLAGATSLAFSSSGSAIWATGTSGTAAIVGAVPIEISSGSVNVDTGASFSIGATIQDGTSATALNKVGGGRLNLTATNNTYSGATTVNGGLLLAGAANALSPYSDVSVGANGIGRHARPHGHGLSANGQVALGRFLRRVEREYRHSPGESQ